MDDDAGDLRGLAVRLEYEIAPLLRTATTPAWQGLAGERYELTRDGLWRAALGAADAFNDAAVVLETYASAVRAGYQQLAAAMEDPAVWSDSTARHVTIDGIQHTLDQAAEDLRVGLGACSNFLPSPTSGISEALRGAGDWWDGLELWQQILVGVAVAGATALSGGSLGVAIGVGGVASYGLEHAHGLADLNDDPVAATQSYFETTTPAATALHVGEAALTFGPGAFGGAVLGTGARHGISQAVRHPHVYAGELSNAMAAGDRGAVDFSAFMRRDPITAANGDLITPLDAAAQPGAAAQYLDQKVVPLSARGQALDYQVAQYGEAERAIFLPNGREVRPDGFNPTYGAVGDAKFVHEGQTSSFYIPETMSSPGIQTIAETKMDNTLTRLSQASLASGGDGIVEMTTNNPRAAAYMEARMSALNITGYVRIVE
ncbi:hypothetical protein GXB85_13410 [Cellulomonas sp. APG4]|uniref:restriction endonuclease fold toxin-2 domain-containing protein n=1 Tax=Cellulomonas sp. APG4 TaxID=1538656 RepID=UPI0013793E65|nr:restriction endonuclease fold toxin-2 domain-containing protein [Cellulomonas sp. APG4]NCT91940.1 hypothetical protein [Cellulomonas sp. APG4]